MKSLRAGLAAALILILTTGAARATSLPEDEILTFGAPAWDTWATAADTGKYDALAPRPGEAPAIGSGAIPVDMAASLLFFSPQSTAQAYLANPVGSGVNIRYTLLITPEALRQGAGLEIPAPAVLFQSGLIAPGQTRTEIALGLLPDGTPLPQGNYTAQMQLESFDQQSNLKSAGTMSVEIPLKILADSRALSVDPEGWARLAVYNGGEEKARYVLAFCAQDLGAATGSQAMLSMESPAYVFARIPLGEVDVGERAELSACLAGKTAVPEGQITAWLLRETEAGLACLSRLELCLESMADLTPLMQTDLEVAQQVVNAQYCLAQAVDETATAEEASSAAPPVSTDANAQALDALRLEGRALEVPLAGGTVWLGPVIRANGAAWNFVLANPEDSGICMIADLRAEDGTLLYRTGLLAPGTMLDGLTILPEAAAISAGRVNVTLYACDPESYVSLGASEIIVEIEEGDR